MDNNEKMLTEMLHGMQRQMSSMEKRQNMSVRNKSSKTKMAGIMTVMIMLMLLTGTYAWNNFNQRALNPLSEITNHGGRIHNNYHIADTELASGDHVKRVFGENFGSSQLFVRIRLREFLTVGVDSTTGEPIPIGMGTGSDGNPVTPSADNSDTWVVYLADPMDANTRRIDSNSELIGNQGINLGLGELYASDRTLYMPTFNRTSEAPRGATEADINLIPPAPFNSEHAFQMTEATGDSFDVVATTFMSSLVLPDPEFTPTPTGPTPPNGTYWEEDETHTALLIVTDHEENGDIVQRVRPGNFDVDGNPVEGGLYTQHTATPTIDPHVSYGSVMTIQQWEDRGFPEGNFWIIDTSDDEGWIYWNGYLNPGDATPLLLNGLNVEPFNESWEYNTTFDSGFFTRTELEAMIEENEISPAAQAIFSDSNQQLEASLNNSEQSNITELAYATPLLQDRRWHMMIMDSKRNTL